MNRRLFTSLFRPKFLSFFFLFLFNGMTALISEAYELVFIHQVSKSRKTFVTRQGKESGVSLGTEATFTTPYISIVARAVTVAREFTQWKVLEPGAEVPFQREQIVTYQGNTEGVWSLDPDRYFFLMAADNDSKKLPHFLQDKEKERLEALKENAFMQSLSLKGFLFRGVSQSVSLANSAQITSREGTQWEILFERKILWNFYAGVGYRRDTELTDSPTILVESTRTYVLGDLSYHFNPSQKSQTTIIYFGLTVGYGQSTTTVAEDTLEGETTILPSFRLGVELLMPMEASLQFEAAAESLSVKESFVDGDQQTSNYVNGRIGLGLKKYF